MFWGRDVSAEFIAGAQRMLELAQLHKVDVVVLKRFAARLAAAIIFMTAALPVRKLKAMG